MKLCKKSVLMLSLLATSTILGMRLQELSERKPGLNTFLNAVIQQDVPTVEKLVTPENINQKNENGRTALMYAAENGNTTIGQKLLDKGANVNEKSNSGGTSLMLAAYYGHKDMVRMLLTAGAKIDEKNNAGNDALKIVQEKLKDPQLNDTQKTVYRDIEAMLKPKKVIPTTVLPQQTTQQQLPPLHEAIEKNDFNEVQRLINSKQAQVDERYEQGSTPLMRAAHLGLKNMVLFLLNQNANVHAKTNNNNTALQLVLNRIQKDTKLNETQKARLQEIADILRQAEMVQPTPRQLINEFITAIKNKNFNEMKRLLQTSRTWINYKDSNDGSTILMDAAGRGSKKFVKLLLDHGADVNATDKEGKTALQHAQDKLQKATDDNLKTLYREIIQLLQQAPTTVQVQQPLQFNIIAEDVQQFMQPTQQPIIPQQFLQPQIVPFIPRIQTQLQNISYQPLLRRSPLHEAVKRGNYDEVKKLLESKKYLIDTDLLTYAINNKRSDIAKLLIQAGADVNLADRLGYTPLIDAVLKVLPDVVQLLLEKNADVNAQRKSSRDTALMIAAANGNADIVQLIIDSGRANVNLKNKNKNNALQLAKNRLKIEKLDELVKERYRKIVELLSPLTTSEQQQPQPVQQTQQTLQQPVTQLPQLQPIVPMQLTPVQLNIPGSSPTKRPLEGAEEPSEKRKKTEDVMEEEKSEEIIDISGDDEIAELFKPLPGITQKEPQDDDIIDVE